MAEVQYDSPDMAKAYGGPGLTVADERYAEVREAVERLTNQIASTEVAAHELGLNVASVTRQDEPRPDSTGPPQPSSGVELADTLGALANRVQAIDGFLRNLDSRIAL